MTCIRCFPQEVEPNSRPLLPRCRTSMHGGAGNDNDDLLTTSAGSPDDLDAVLTRNASNSTQLGLDTHAALDNPLGCALFQGAPGDMSEQGHNNSCPHASPHDAVDGTTGKLTPVMGASTIGAVMMADIGFT